MRGVEREAQRQLRGFHYVGELELRNVFARDPGVDARAAEVIDVEGFNPLVGSGKFLCRAEVAQEHVTIHRRLAVSERVDARLADDPPGGRHAVQR